MVAHCRRASHTHSRLPFHLLHCDETRGQKKWDFLWALPHQSRSFQGNNLHGEVDQQYLSPTSKNSTQGYLYYCTRPPDPSCRHIWHQLMNYFVFKQFVKVMVRIFTMIFLSHFFSWAAVWIRIVNRVVSWVINEGFNWLVGQVHHLWICSSSTKSVGQVQGVHWYNRRTPQPFSEMKQV